MASKFSRPQRPDHRFRSDKAKVAIGSRWCSCSMQLWKRLSIVGYGPRPALYMIRRIASNSRTPKEETADDVNKTIDQLLSGIGIVPRSDSSKKKSPVSSGEDTLQEVRQAYDQYKSGSSGNQMSQAGAFARNMTFPNANAAQTGKNVSNALSLMNYKTQVPLKKRTIRSRPSVGRTVELDQNRGMDFGRALKQVNILCSTNRVRREASQQRFHERPGLKRKRLKRDRWRVFFMKGFKATVGRVKEMRRKGW